MIKDSYNFCFIEKDRPGEDDIFLYKHLYRFKSSKSNLFYLVNVEFYECNVIAVKFYLKNNRLSKNKYNLLSYTFEPRKIIHTCINIMLEVYRSNKLASFGFVGSNSLGEDVFCTKRYKFYSKIVATYFGEEIFFHKENKEKSAYILVNNEALSKNPNLVQQIETFFNVQFDYFED